MQPGDRQTDSEVLVVGSRFLYTEPKKNIFEEIVVI